MDILVAVILGCLAVWLAVRGGKTRSEPERQSDEDDSADLSVDDMVLMEMLEDDEHEH